MDKSIENIAIKHTVDYDADLSFIGTFDNEAKSELAVDHWKELGYDESSSFHYFNPQPEACETKEQAKQDYERLMAYEKGHWYMIGIRAEATIKIGNLLQHITSGGLYGIESDASEAYKEEIGLDELDELKDTLRELGFTTKQIETVKVTRPNDN